MVISDGKTNMKENTDINKSHCVLELCCYFCCRLMLLLKSVCTVCNNYMPKAYVIQKQT